MGKGWRNKDPSVPERGVEEECGPAGRLYLMPSTAAWLKSRRCCTMPLQGILHTHHYSSCSINLRKGKTQAPEARGLWLQTPTHKPHKPPRPTCPLHYRGQWLSKAINKQRHRNRKRNLMSCQQALVQRLANSFDMKIKRLKLCNVDQAL